VVALDDVSLTLARGSSLAVLGPNGSGKSTLLRILATLITPTAGTVEVGGYSLSQGDYVRAQIGWATGDERSFYWPLSGWANLEFFAALRGLHGRAAATRITQVLNLVGLMAQAAQPFRAYSSGQRQRLALARALLADPPLLLLDEPTRSLDPDAAAVIRAVLRAQNAAGHTLLWVTHDPAEAAACCHRALWLDAGRIVREEY
jgi:ABC-2 type transport system ATP-binding protein